MPDPIPQEVRLVCSHCGKARVESTSYLLQQPVVVTKSLDPSIKERTVHCSNCDKAVNVDVPKEWTTRE